MCYGLTVAILSLLILLTISIAMFWAIEIIKYRSHIIKNQDLSSSAVYNVTSDFPLGNVFSNKLCLNMQETHSEITVNKLAYVSLASEDCDTVTVSTYNETVSQDSIFGHNYMFYWLSGTTVSFFAEVNGSSVMSVFLLESKRSFDLCTNHITPSPDEYLKMWVFNLSNCYLVTRTGYMECHFHYKATKSAYYYICVNSTIEYDLQFNISISSLAYNTSKSEMAIECTPSEECCLPFNSVFRELYQPTCMFVTTTPLSPTFSGIKLTEISVRVDQRLEVVWYCVAAFLPLLLVLVATTLLCKATSCKAKNPDINGRQCVLYCSVYNNANAHNRL